MDEIKVYFIKYSTLLRNAWSSAGTEARLVLYVTCLYTTFIYWGYLQEKLTSTKYSRRLLSTDDTSIPTTMSWNYPFVLNLSMSLTAALAGYLSDTSRKSKVSLYIFWKPSLTSALASPIGYTSLKFINYPMMILTKSSKPVPVMLIGSILYKKTYKWFKYTSVLFLCCGIALFTASKGSSSNKDNSSTEDDHPILHQLFGVLLIFINLCLDGYTNNEQDHIFAAHRATPIQMTKYTNVWQSLYLFGYLMLGLIIRGSGSELSNALNVIYSCPVIKYDILMFCLCASVGQILICGLIQEFGSLVWITVSVTRQLFTVLLSVFIFNHSVNGYQWFGIFLVFSGLILEIVMVYKNKEVITPSTSLADIKLGSTLDSDSPTNRGRGESVDIESAASPRGGRKKIE